MSPQKECKDNFQLEANTENQPTLTLNSIKIATFTKLLFCFQCVKLKAKN